jgi:hypothetical protein
MIKKSTLILFVAFTTSLGFAQKKPKDAVAPTSAINTDSIAVLILKNLNTVRTALNLDVLEFDDMLAKASMEQAEDMADRGKADLSNGPTGKRVVKAGGTTNAEELVISMATLKGKTSMTSAELADAIVKKWQSGKKEQALIVNGNFIYASPSIKLDESGKKAYVSVVLGKELAVRYTRKNKKIKPADEKACKNCEKFKDYEGLLKGLYVEENKVYLKYSNMKTFGQLISKPTDGLAFDIVQRAQYDKPEYNILDNNLLSKGILSIKLK